MEIIADYGMKLVNTVGVTITGLDVQGFRGPPNAGGGAINVVNARNFELAHSVLKNSATDSGSACSGTLGLGDLRNAKIHDLTIVEDKGYGVKNSITNDGYEPAPSRIYDSEFYNLNVQATSSTCALWNTLSFELFETDAFNTTIRNSSFNRTVSLTDIGQGSALTSGHRYRIHNNLFTVASGNAYAIELDQHSSVIDHNFFNGGLYPSANFVQNQAKTGNLIHHNVFDNQSGPTAATHFVGGLLNARFYNNTVVLRQSSWRDGVFSLQEVSSVTSTIDLRNNYFTSPSYNIGDKLGLGLQAATIDRNGFYNTTPKGSNQVAGNPMLPLTGGFPAAYIPAAGSPAIDRGTAITGITDGFGGSAPDLGAFESGTTWKVGPQ